MRVQLAIDDIVLHYGGNAVVLRPSLRAAVRLERLHDGFPALLRKIEEFDTRTTWQVIDAAAGRDAFEALAALVAHQPLKGFQRAAQSACLELVAAFFPMAPQDEPEQSQDAKAVPWAELFAQLHGFATGWLGWTPDTAWTATPQEITSAFNAHVIKLKAIYGDADAERVGTDDAQRNENEALGLDPEFDRAGLRRLKALSAQREGMPV